MKRIFVSYSRRDMGFVTQLAQDLQQAGNQVWYDLSRLDGGDRWGREIQNAISQSDVLLLVVSPNSIESEWVEKEFLYASKMRRKIIPILHEDCDLPIWLLNIHYVDVQGRNYKQNFSRILRALEEDVETDTHVSPVDTSKAEKKNTQPPRRSTQKGVGKKTVPLGIGALAIACIACIGLALLTRESWQNVIAPFLPGAPGADTSVPATEPPIEMTDEPVTEPAVPVTEAPITDVPATEPSVPVTEAPITEEPATEPPAPQPTPFGGGGQKIAFVVDNQIWTMNLDGSDPTQLTFPPELNVKPDWSPDGSRIVFISRRDGNSEIYVMNADGSGQTRLTFGDLSESEPAWSPDGEHIAYSADGEIYVMLADGSDPTRLTANDDLDDKPDWSPDGTRIVFESNRTGELVPGVFGMSFKPSEIYVMNANGTEQTRLTYEPAVVDFYPSWSPDGGYIAFVSQRDGHNQIYLMNSDGSGQHNLTQNQTDDSDPAWSPDSTMIIYVSRTRGTDDIYIMNIDGTIVSRLTDNDIYDIWPVWQP